MHLELLVEERSAEEALRQLVPRIVPNTVSFAIHPHEGKSDLLDKLPRRLRGYCAWVPPDYRIIVLVDEDRADCRELKRRLEDQAKAARLWTRTTAPASQPILLVNRIAVEELEAWFFGDVPAMVAAYPGVSPSLGRQAKYRDPDQIRGGTWEALERILQHAGYHPGGLAKIEAARRIAERMDPDRNRSPSFQQFRDALRRLTTERDND